MKFDAATTRPGLANIGQNFVDPSAKSIQSVFPGGSEHGSGSGAPACDPAAAAYDPAAASTPAAATAATTPRKTLLTAALCSRSGRRPCRLLRGRVDDLGGVAVRAGETAVG